jgi:hypothetical protein
MAIDLKLKLEAAKAAAAAAETLLTDSDKLEIEQRVEIAKLEGVARTAAIAKRDLELDRRYDAASEAMPDAKLDKLTVQEFPEDAFVLKYSGKAHADFESALRRAKAGETQKHPADFAPPRRQYALRVVVDWNGRTNYDGTDSQFSVDLAKYLTENPGLVTPITEMASTLAGIVAEERKS